MRAQPRPDLCQACGCRHEHPVEYRPGRPAPIVLRDALRERLARESAQALRLYQQAMR